MKDRLQPSIALVLGLAVLEACSGSVAIEMPNDAAADASLGADQSTVPIDASTEQEAMAPGEEVETSADASLDTASPFDVIDGDIDLDAGDHREARVRSDAPLGPCNRDGLGDVIMKSTPEGTSLCSADGWCWAHELPTGLAATSLWGTSADDVWAALDGGTILHWDGAGWSGDMGVVIASGGRWRLHGTSWEDIWAVSDKGGIVHFNGEQWCAVMSGTDLALRGIWAISPSDAWAVGGGHAGDDFTPVGPVVSLHWDGQAWKAIDLKVDSAYGGPGDRIDVYDVWASRSDDVWVVGTGFLYALPGVAHPGYIAHWDGLSWRTFPPAADSGYELRRSACAIWGSAASDIWAGGQFLLDDPAGVMLQRETAAHWDGTTWTITADPEACLLSGTSARDVWGLQSNQLIHWNGSSWAPVPASKKPDLPWFSALWASGPNDVWVGVAGGGIVARWNGSSWQRPLPAPSDLGAVWTASPSDAWAVGNGGTTLHFDGSTWTDVSSTVTTALHAVSGVDGTDVWAAGDSGVILRSRGSGWNAVTLPSNVTQGRTLNLGAISARAQDDVWVVSNGDQAFLRWNGAAWSASTFPSAAGGSVAAIAADGALDAWAVGTDVYRWNGTDWTQLANPPVASIPDAGGGSPSGFAGVWVESPTSVWLLRSGGEADAAALFHGDGNVWQPVFTTAGDTFLGMSARSSTDIWIGGTNHVYHWDGAMMKQVAAGRGGAIAGLGPKDVWAVGALGSIERLTLP
jgi:hypothetical protein